MGERIRKSKVEQIVNKYDAFRSPFDPSLVLRVLDQPKDGESHIKLGDPFSLNPIEAMKISREELVSWERIELEVPDETDDGFDEVMSDIVPNFDKFGGAPESQEINGAVMTEADMIKLITLGLSIEARRAQNQVKAITADYYSYSNPHDRPYLRSDWHEAISYNLQFPEIK